MPEPRLLFDSRLRGHYLGYGRYRRLLPFLNIKIGLGRKLDKLVLTAQSFLPFLKRKPDGNTRMLWERLMRIYPNQISAALFYDTSWYKETTFIGLFEIPQGKNFIKIYPKQEDLVYQQHQARFIQEYFTGPFTTIPVTRAQDIFLVSPYVQKKRPVDKEDHIASNIIHLCNKLKDTTQVFKTPQDIIPIDIGVTFMKANEVELYRKIRTWIAQQNYMLPIIPVHGDLTPWNLFVSLEEKIVLTDYERAGWHVPFYDYFHFVLQPLALKPSAPTLSSLKLELEYKYQRETLIIYLIDQLYHDMVNHFDKGYQHQQILYLIKNKQQWLLELLNG